MSVSRRGVLAGAVAAPAVVRGPAASGQSAGPTPLPKPGEDPDKRSRSPAPETDALARHAVSARFEDLDSATLAAVKLRVLDLVGCALGGARAGGNADLVAVVAAGGSSPQASIIGYPVKAAVAEVAMANAVIARSYDFEVMTAVVGDKAVPSHHSPTTCMTALALAEQGRRSGRDFLTALAVGDDIAARLLVASGLDFGQGWDGSPVYSALAAVAIAARFRGLDAQKTRDAFGMAVDQIGGTIQNIWDGATDFKLPQGAVARNAILSVDLAARGWTGMGDALMSPFGFYAQYTPGCADPGVLTRDLGRVFHGEGYFKPYPACMAVHPSIDAALALRARYDLDPAQIERVTLRLPPALMANFCAKPFEARRFAHADANFSFQFLVANALLRGAVRQEHYDERAIRSAEMAAMVRRTTLSPLGAGKTGLELEVVTRDGRTLTQVHGPVADHHPFAKPSTRDQIVAKFHQQAAFSGFVTTAHAAEIAARIDRLDQELDMAAFTALITRASLPLPA